MELGILIVILWSMDALLLLSVEESGRTRPSSGRDDSWSQHSRFGAMRGPTLYVIIGFQKRLGETNE
jgi:hypothetical protein